MVNTRSTRYFIFKEIADNVNQGEKQMEENIDEEEYFDHKRFVSVNTTNCEPINANHTVVREFYADSAKTIFVEDLVATRLPTRPRERSLASSIVSSTLSTLVHDQQFVDERMEMMEKRNKKMMEHEKKKTRFLKKMMDMLQKFCGSGDDVDDVL
uniref:Uncharacterized protein n=1 Tax=Solanum tuberosum TaxID=4113 RepID=M1DP33_SOLTU